MEHCTGFVYSQTRNRMWRKNRQAQPGTSCIGRDLNRNWDVHWDDSQNHNHNYKAGSGGGAST
jgi:hypothetical protein